MKNVGKIIIFIFLGLFGIILIAGLLGPKEVSVEKSITIDQPISQVFEYASDFNHMIKWNPLMEQDPQAKHTISGKSGKPGSRWSWQGESVGKGYYEIKEIVPNKKIVSDLKFIKPWESHSKDIRKFKKTAQGTEVIWIAQSELSYPIERLVGIFMDERLGATINKGLENLKDYANQQASMTPIIKTIKIEGMTCTGCEKTIQKAINTLPGVIDVKASHKDSIATIKVDSNRFNPSDYRNAIEGVGYKMEGIK